VIISLISIADVDMRGLTVKRGKSVNVKSTLLHPAYQYHEEGS